MGEVQSGLNRYVERVAIVDEICRTEDYRYVEIYGVWADTGAAFRNQFVLRDLRLALGNPVYVIQQVGGLGEEVGAWIAYTSDAATRIYVASNLPAKIVPGIRDRIAAVPNVVLELAAIGAAGLAGWQYSWWAAILAGAVVGGRPWYGRLKRYRAERELDIARRDQASILAQAAERLGQLRKAWNAGQDGCEAEDASHQDNEPGSQRRSNSGNWWREKLNLSDTATLADAERAYRSCLKECHPDLHMNLSERMQALAREEAQVLNAAVEAARRHFASDGPQAARTAR